jgi:hypothetical protein
MPRIDLRVPFTKREEARRLGARWDAGRKLWYVPDGVAAEPLAQWLPVRPAPNVRSDRYLLLVTTRDCWWCKAATQVFGLALPEGYQALHFYAHGDEDDDPAQPGKSWRTGRRRALLSYVWDLADPVAQRLGVLAPRYHLDFSQTIQEFYWMNHCEHCEAKLGDNNTFHELGVGFDPLGPNEIRIQAEIVEPFSATCSCNT